MKVISIQQPFATLIAIQEKQFETRSWSTKHRGPIGIHASKKIDNESYWRFDKILKKYGINSPEDLPTGAIIAIAELTECHKVIEDSGHFSTMDTGLEIGGFENWYGDYSVGRYAWKLENIQQLANPVPAKGKLSLWEIDETLLQ